MKTIVIYGYGKTGKAIADNLLDKYKIIPIRKNTFFKKIKLAKADLIVLSAAGKIKGLRMKKFRTTHDLRLAETKINREIVKEFARKVKNTNVPIIVVTNNSDLFAEYLKKRLKRRNIHPFGLILDELRFSQLLNQKVVVVGYHGLAIPIIGKKHKEKYLQVIGKEDKSVLENFHKKGIDYKFVGKAFRQYLDNFGQTGKRIPLNKVETGLLKRVNKKLKEDYNRLLG